MYGDFSHLSFNRARDFTAVWPLQGRFLLDADLNEQTAILLDWMRTLATDFIGPAGGHVPGAGFEVSLDGDGNLHLGNGHYYVAGIRCEVRQDPAAGMLRHAELPNKPYIVALRVWERTVSQALCPRLREPALGPTHPDTTIRTQVAWSLELVDPPAGTVTDPNYRDRVAEQFEQLNEPKPAAMGARVVLTSAESDPDESATISGYSGLENQLYRIEIHNGSDHPDGPTFKWSRDNGSVEYGIEKFEVHADTKTTTVTLPSLVLPGRATLEIGDCVEVVDLSWLPFDAPGRLFTVIDIGRVGRSVVLDGAIEASLPAVLRNWDSVPNGGTGTPILDPPNSDGWFPIEMGIEARFPDPDKSTFRRGDFWLVPARAATANIWAPEEPVAPYGPERRYAPLAHVDGTTVTELRTLFTHLAWPIDTAGGTP